VALWRVLVAGTPRVAFGALLEGPQALLPTDVTIGRLLAEGPRALEAAAAGAVGAESPADRSLTLLAPCDGQEIWAAGVTFERSRQARGEESDHHDVYDRVYEADRPELFLKATMRNVRGPDAPLGIRPDSTWDVPEPELALVLCASGEIAGYAIGNDMSSRSIEADNPLYLAQAKIYDASCGLGPAIVCCSEAPDPETFTIRLAIERDGETIYDESTSVAEMKRSLGELSNWLMRAQSHPTGVFLLCGTSLIPPNEMTLRDRDAVVVSITGLGELRNTVSRLDRNPDGMS
jgi:2-dehydro-3-deoxy-D-arabinonate dehydratase